MARLIGVFGGTFDPVHNGHLRTALDVVEAGNPDRLLLIPCHLPPHRGEPMVSSRQRLRMLELAVAGESRFRVDDRELRRDQPSYTVDTLLSLQRQYPGDSFFLLLGMDSFLGLPRWHRWRELEGLAHMVVMSRPESATTTSDELTRWLAGRHAEDWQQLRAGGAGRVLFQDVARLAISATDVRRRLANGGSARYLMPEAVWSYIQEQGLYGAVAAMSEPRGGNPREA